MKVAPTDRIDGLGLSEECLDILRQAGIETSKQFVEVEWADVATICGATPRKLYAIFRARDQIKTSLGVVDKLAMPAKPEHARSAPANENKAPDRDLRPDQLPPQATQFALQSTQELPVGFLSSLGFGVRARNVLAQMNLKSAAQFIALDEQTLLRRRNCGKKTVAEIMDVVRGYKPPGEAIPRQMDVFSLSPSQENMPISYLRLSARARNGLESIKISTVGQLAKVSDRELMNVHSFGKKSLREVRSKFAVFCSDGGLSPGRKKRKRLKFPADPKVFLEQLLAALPERQREILVGRFGLWDGTRMTLQDLADIYGCSRERIRQQELKAIESLIWPGNIDSVRRFFSWLARKHLRIAFQKGLGLATEDELQSIFLSLFASPAEGITAERFLSLVFFEGGSIYDGSWSKVQDGLFASDATIKKRYLSLTEHIQERLVRANEPVAFSRLASYARRKTRSLPRRIPSDFILRCIEACPYFSIDSLGRYSLTDRRYLQPKTIKAMIVCALIDIRIPAHYSQVAMRMDEMFPDKAPFNPRSIHARLCSDQKTFVWQALGVYGLAAWGLKKAPYVIDRLRQLFDASQQPMSIGQIVPKVLETCRCKETTVNAILDANPDMFIKFDKGIYGLKSWVS